MHTLLSIAAVLLFESAAKAQLVDEFNAPPANCCLLNTAKSLADQLQDWNQLGRYQPGALPTLNPVTGLSNLNTPTFYDPGLGRPRRVSQYNVALQREVIRNLPLEAAWVGNRGAWLQGALYQGVGEQRNRKLA
jgi:hypothetical protein